MVYDGKTQYIKKLNIAIDMLNNNEWIENKLKIKSELLYFRDELKSNTKTLDSQEIKNNNIIFSNIQKLLDSAKNK